MQERLGHYLLQQVIGVGSFATVYQAVDERLNATVVIKLLAENHSLNPEIRERFIAEGRNLRRAQGPHVVTIYDIGESSENQPYLVLEHADRGSLEERITGLWAQGWWASREDILSFSQSLAASVAAVHSAQLVHRDLSPRNLLLTTKLSRLSTANEPSGSGNIIREEERLLIADLGICKDLALNSGLTVAGGTSGFRPPEQEEIGVVDTRADIWAASAVLKWVAQGADLPHEFHDVIKRGMETKPKKRQKDVAQWLAEIEEALKREDPDEKHSVGQTPMVPGPQQNTLQGEAPRPRRTTRKARLILAAVLAVVFLVGGAVLWAWVGPEKVAETPSSSGNASVNIEGPEEVSVGETADFTAETEGVDSWSWSLPNGRHVAEEDEVSVVPSSPGTAEVVLRSTTSDGEEIEARRTLRVTN